jgi:hypothetical protein
VRKIPYNADQRRRTYRALREILDRLERDDSEVASRDIRPDGYTSVSNGGSRRSGHGDPTYAVVVQILGGEAQGSLAAQCFGHLHMAAKELELADSLRAGCIPPVQRISEDDWCVSCLRVVLKDHKGRSHRLCSPRYGSQDVCAWCHQWRKEHGSEPPVALLVKRSQGKRITSRDIQEAV